MENAVKLHSLSFSQTKTYIVVTALVAGNILLPALCHLIPRGGLIFLPIYFFTLFGAYKYGLQAGLATAILSPVVSYLLTGMPMADMLPAIILKSVFIALTASYAARRFGKVTIPILAAVVLLYQTVGTLAEWALVRNFFAATQDFRLAVPGMLLQVFGFYGLMKLMQRFSL